LQPPSPPNSKKNRTKDQAEREISATELNMLPCLYPWSINVVVYHDPSGKSHLGRARLYFGRSFDLPTGPASHLRGVLNRLGLATPTFRSNLSVALKFSPKRYRKIVHSEEEFLS
jgi:hypothetical protein